MPTGDAQSPPGWREQERMALRRHQVENLVLRGPVFYWRARIPAGFNAAGRNACLSLSLRLSDRKKASVVARRLNALLLQLELVPKARMATKEQLARIFALEIEAMREEIENLDRMTRRNRSLRDPVHRQADRQTGLTYRMLERYGPWEDLDFDPGSEVYAELLAAGATEDDIPWIAEMFRSERKEMLADRAGTGRTPFMRDVLHRMAQVGLDDTVANREAAAETIYRARADAWLASAADPRKPSLIKRPEPPTSQPVETMPVPEPARPRIHWKAEESEPVELARVRASAEPPSSDPASLTADRYSVCEPPPSPTIPPIADRGPARKNLPLSQFGDEVEMLIANHKDDWEEATASDVRVLVEIFRGILEEHGVTHSGQITQEHVAALRQHFNHIVPNWGRSPRLRSLSTRELRDESRRLAEGAEARGKPIRLGLSAATIRRHLGNLDHFLKHLRASYYAVGDWTFDGLRPKKPKRGEIRLQLIHPH